MKLEEFNLLEKKAAGAELFKCCGSNAWKEKVMKHFPFPSITELLKWSDQSWDECKTEDFLEAFSHHPKIGEKPAATHDSTQHWASQEQSGVKSADQEVLDELAELNKKYFEKFGFIFIICATGKTAPEMLASLNERINNSQEKEIQIAAAEQNKITHLRIEKLFS